MSLPRRRRSRPRGAARLALAGDFTDTGETVTEILERVPPDRLRQDRPRRSGAAANDIGPMAS